MADQDTPTPEERNDDRSRQMNPEDERGQAAADNRSGQLNPEDNRFGQIRPENPETNHPAWDNPGRAGVSNSGG